MATIVESEGAKQGSFYRAVWRWHFIAGLLVLPFLCILATTGALYLFKDELDAWIYHSWDRVAAGAATKPLPELIATVEAASRGKVMQLTLPVERDRAIRMTVHAEGQAQTAFVDPYSGELKGITRYGGVMQVVRKLHSLQYFGAKASWLMEIAAGWAIVLVATGVYLWWPRGASGGVVTIRGSPRKRTFWRDVHAVTGAFAGALVLFLAVTGMPWSDVWGGQVQDWATAAGVSRPPAPAEVVPDWQLENVIPTGTDDRAHHRELIGLPWALEKAPAPVSTLPRGTPIDADQAAAALARAGLPKPYSLTLPQGPRGAFAATHTTDRIEDIRVVYVDQYNGDVLDDVGYARFGAAAKAIEWGIAVHQGQEYGSVNRYLMLGGCLAIIALAVSSVTMWWKRRPQGRLGMPPPPQDPRSLYMLAALVVPFAIAFPLVGVSLLVAFAIDRGLATIRAMRAL